MLLIRTTGVLLLGILLLTPVLTKAQTVDLPVKNIDSAFLSPVKQKAAQLKDKAAGLGKKLVPVDTGFLKQSLQLSRNQFEQLIRESTIPLQDELSKIQLFDKSKMLKPGVVQIDAGYTYMRDTTGVALGAFNELSGIFNYNVNAGVTLFEMPFDVSFRGMNGVYTVQHTTTDNLMKFNFDHEKYVQKIRAAVAAKLNPQTVLAGAVSRINALRDNYERTLRSEIESLRTDFGSEYKTMVDLPPGITDLSKTDMASLKSRLMNVPALQGYEASAARIQEAVKKGTIAEADTALMADMAKVKQREMLEKVYQKILAAKDGFENNKLVKELKGHLPFTPENYKSFLANPGNLSKILDDHIDLNFVQRLFVNMTKLDIGQNPVQNGDFSMQNLVNTGINTQFQSPKTTVGLIYGKNNNINNWLQAGLGSTVSNEYSSVSGFSFGSGSGKALQQMLSVNLYNFNNSPGSDFRDGALQASYLGIPRRKDATISFHTGYSIKNKHTISVDVSKSLGAFTDQISADSIPYTANAHSEVFSNAGKSNYAAMVDYEGELLNTDVRAFAKTVGLGYNNPGNSLLRRGETQFGLGLARKLLNNKLTTRYSIDYRKQNFDPLKRYTHIAVNNKIQLGYKISRNNRIGLTYQRSDYSSHLFAFTSTGGGNDRLQLDGAYAFKISGKRIMNNVTISRQQFDIPMLADQNYKSKAVMVMYSSVAMLNKSPLSLQLILNRSDNKDYLFNTSMFTAETNYSYPINERIRFGSGLGYYANTGWNRQIGGKQQLSAVLMEKLSLDFEVSYKKAIQVIRPELANQLFVTAGAHFTF